MKKITSLLTLLLLTHTAFAEPTVCAPEACCDAPCAALFVDGEYLYWNASQAGMNYVLTLGSLTALTTTDTTSVGQEFDWGSGFRVGVGAELFSRPCDLELSWTRFHHTNTSSTSGPLLLANQLLGTDAPLIIGGPAFGSGPATSAWNLRLDLVELDFGYRLFGNGTYLHPYLGVIGGRINQTQTINYINFTTLDALINATVVNTNNFNGVGPKVGMDGNFRIWDRLQLVGNLSASFLYGKANNPTSTAIISDDVEEVPSPNLATSYEQRRMIPVFQSQVGLAWATSWNCFFFDIAALYETGYYIGTWRNQNSATQNIFITDAGYSNLATHGLTLKLIVGY